MVGSTTSGSTGVTEALSWRRWRRFAQLSRKPEVKAMADLIVIVGMVASGVLGLWFVRAAIKELL